MVKNVDILINNEARGSTEKFDVVNSGSGEVVFTATSASKADAIAAADAAQAAFPAWAATNPQARRDIFLKAAGILEQDAQELIDIYMKETNCTKRWAHDINIMGTLGLLKELASLATSIGGEVPISDFPNEMAIVLNEPYGVILAMAPWNAAVVLGMRAMVGPMVCGNTVVFKASELCPATHGFLAQIFHRAGLPKGVLNVVQTKRQASAEVVEALIAHRAIRKINFTGSTMVGKIISELAGRYLKPVLLELGGKAALIVLEDADLDAAAIAASMGGNLHHGQICMATERIIVHESVAKPFMSKLIEQVKSFPPDNAVTVEALEKGKKLLDTAKSHGAKVEVGGSSTGASLSPTVLSNVNEENPLFHQESFSPFLSFHTVKDMDEAIKMANNTSYGLNCSVFTRDVPKGIHVAKRLEVGTCCINSPTVHDASCIPHGGRKESGFGRFNSRWSIREFTTQKTIIIQSDYFR